MVTCLQQNQGRYGSIAIATLLKYNTNTVNSDLITTK